MKINETCRCRIGAPQLLRIKGLILLELTPIPAPAPAPAVPAEATPAPAVPAEATPALPTTPALPEPLFLNLRSSKALSYGIEELTAALPQLIPLGSSVDDALDLIVTGILTGAEVTVTKSRAREGDGYNLRITPNLGAASPKARRALLSEMRGAAPAAREGDPTL